MNKKIIYDYSDWIDFPRVIAIKDIFVNIVEYKNKFVEISDYLYWQSPDKREKIKFDVAYIKLNPTIRVFSDSTKEWYLLVNCTKIKK